MQNNGNKKFKWWYAEEALSYKELLEAKTAAITAMTQDEEIVRQTVPLDQNQGLVMVKLGAKGTYYLTPNQQITLHTENLKDFWLVQNRCCWETPVINGIVNAIEDGKALKLPEGIELFGKPTERSTTLKSFQVKAIVPIGDGKYIAWEDGNRCAVVGPRETDDTAIAILMRRTAR